MPALVVRPLAVALLACLLPASAAASAFLVSKMGGDLSGATEDNAASVFWNPAAIGPIERPSLMLDCNLSWRWLDFERRWDEGFDSAGREPRSSMEAMYTLPLIGLTARPGVDWVTLGLAFYVPFGHRSDWPGWDIEAAREDPQGEASIPSQAFHTLTGGITALYTTPAAAFRLTDWLWVGGGISWVYAMVDAQRARDFSQEILPGVLPPERLAYSGTAGLDFAGHGWAWSLGVLARPWSWLRLGLSFTSGTDLDLPGEAWLTLPPLLQSALGSEARVSSQARLHMQLPPALRAGAHFDLTDWLVFRVTVEHVFWSVYDEVVISGLAFADGQGTVEGLADVTEFVSPRQYHDALDLRAGFRVFPWPWWMIFVGAGFDTVAIPERTTTPDLYDAPKFGLALGSRLGLVPPLEWLLDRELASDDWVALAVGVTWVHYLERSIEESRADPPIAGTYRHEVLLLNMNLDFRF